MSRGTAPRLAMIALAVAALVPLALPAEADSTPRPERTVTVSDFAFNPVPVPVEAGDTVVWVLDSSALATHTVSSDQDGGFHQELVPGVPFKREFKTAGTFGYVCLYHRDQGMVGTVEVTDPPPPPTTTTTTEPPTTTTTTAPPPTTTTTMAPAPTTTTTRPRSTTTTTRPAATPTTQPPASASNDTSGTTSTTARATTTTGKATTTTGKKKPTTTTTKPPETTTTSALPADWIPTPEMSPDGSPTTTTTGPELQAAADHRPKSGKAGGFPIAGAAGLGVLLLGGLGWAWYHRSSRYLPA